VSNRSPKDPSADYSEYSRKVGTQEARKLKTRRRGATGVWSGFGMFGLIGWSVSVPTLLGALLGTWLDKRRPGAHSWTLSLLIAGLCVGCINAWYWVSKEEAEIHASAEEGD
jgi:ATP synthase protein I